MLIISTIYTVYYNIIIIIILINGIKRLTLYFMNIINFSTHHANYSVHFVLHNLFMLTNNIGNL